MGRKIPGRKHRGVRDPEKQRAQQLSKSNYNVPPTNTDDQPIPKSALRIVELIKNTKNKQNMIPKKVTHKKKKSMKKPIKVHTKVMKGEKPVPKFEQRKGESDHAFLYRVNHICQNVRRETDFEKKFGVDVLRNEETGEVIRLAKRKTDPVEEMIKSVRQEKKMKKILKKQKKTNENLLEPKLSKAKKRSLKLKEKKKKMELLNTDEFKQFSDVVKFGEVTHAPPSLPLPKFVSKKNEASRPGQKQLLLNSLIKNDVTSTNRSSDKSSDVVKKVSHKVIDKKGKRKDLPHALRRTLENQQKEIIAAYKSIQSLKRQNKFN